MSKSFEYCIYCIYNGGRPFILDTYSNITNAKIKLYDLVNLEEERNRPYFVDNDFFDNKYNINVKGKYFCIKCRIVTNWENFKENTINRDSNNIILWNDLKKISK